MLSIHDNETEEKTQTKEKRKRTKQTRNKNELLHNGTLVIYTSHVTHTHTKHD